MDRRTFLTGVAGIGVILTGCIQLTSGSSDNNPTEQTPHPLPQKPKKLTNKTVARHVAKHEEAVLYNEIRNDSDEDYARVELDCTASVENKTKNGYYVTARCGGAVYKNANSGEHGDVLIYTKYLVNETTTRRLSTTND